LSQQSDYTRGCVC